MEPALSTLVQDRDGFIWIATENGLLRYDGTTFKKWSLPEGLPSTFVFRVLPLKAGGLWVGTGKGVVRFQDGKFSGPLLDAGKPLQPQRNQIALDGQERLWLLADDGLRRTQGDKTLERIPGGPSARARAMTVHPGNGSVFLAVPGALWERKADGAWNSWTSQDGLPADNVEALAVDGLGRLWVVGTKSLNYLAPGDRTLHDVSSWLPGPLFIGGVINPSNDGSVAIPTHGGLLRILGDGHELVDQAAGLPTKWTTSSLMDREGNLWVTGPRLYRRLGRGYVRNFGTEDGLPSDLVWHIDRDRLGRLWAGTADGLARLGPGGWVKVPGTEGLSVAGVVLDLQDRLWIGSVNHRLRCLGPRDGKADEAPFRALTWEDGAATGLAATLPERSSAIAMERGGALWLVDPDRGLFRLDLTKGTIRQEFTAAAAKVPGLSFRVIGMGPDDQPWVGTSHGLFTRDGAGWHRWTRAHGLRDDYITGVSMAGDGSAWLTFQESVGITRVELKAGALKVVEQRDAASGLTSNLAYSVAQDPRGILWVGSDRGLDRLEKSASFHISQGGGLPGEDCSANALLVEANGDVWLGTSTGLAHVIAANRPPAVGTIPVFLLTVKRGKATLAPPFQNLPALSSREATLEFRFASPTYISEKAVIYQVRMVGLEDEWRSIDVPQARYTALPAGRYRFEVRSAYPGQAFGPVASYAVEVLPPWWATWWFRSIAFLAVAGLITLFVNGRLRTLARQKRRLAALVDRRTEDLLKANHALEKANLALKSQSLTDPLTGLHNRRFLSVVVDEDVAKVQRAYRDSGQNLPLPNTDMVFLMADLDHFKKINDHYGHGTGDKVLELVAQALRKAARETDAVIRWGGEEFLIMARNATRAEAHLLAERIRSFMAEQELVLETGEVLHWSCSVGFAAYPFQLEDPSWMGWERVVEIADAALYLAKKAGRDGWVGAAARPGLQRAVHGPRLPWELEELKHEEVLDLHSSRPEAFKKALRTGEVFG